MVVDGLEFTRKWLKQGKDKLAAVHSPQQGIVDEEGDGASVLSPKSILTCSYLQLLEWDNKNIFPEVNILQNRN